MKKLTCVVFVMSVIPLLGVANQFARSDDGNPPTIKEVMQKLHKGPNAALAKLKKEVAKDTFDWKETQELAKEFEVYGAALSKNDPPKGETDDWKKLADSYLANAKKLNSSAKTEDKDGVKAALSKISTSCAACHKAHKPS